MAHSTHASLTPCAGTYEPGDVVTLVTGGPDMTVNEVCECGNVLVDWFTFSEDMDWMHWREKFPAISLELAS